MMLSPESLRRRTLGPTGVLSPLFNRASPPWFRLILPPWFRRIFKPVSIGGFSVGVLGGELPPTPPIVQGELRQWKPERRSMLLLISSVRIRIRPRLKRSSAALDRGASSLKS